VQTKYIIYFETTAVFQKQPTRYIAEIRAKSGTYLGEFSGVKSEVNLHLQNFHTCQFTSQQRVVGREL
jgi:hypothetical protein